MQSQWWTGLQAMQRAARSEEPFLVGAIGMQQYREALMAPCAANKPLNAAKAANCTPASGKTH